jgi:hypothetical protein
MGFENYTPPAEELSDALDGEETPEEAREKEENSRRKREEKEDGGDIVEPFVDPKYAETAKFSLVYDKMRADPANKDIKDIDLIGLAEKKAKELE